MRIHLANMKTLLLLVSMTGIFHESMAAEMGDALKMTQDDLTNECTVLQWESKSFNKPYMYIRKPGRYCLDRDYSFTCYPWTHGCGGEFIDIRSNDVDIDLRGHTLSVSGTRGYTGVWGLGKNIRVHNGVIKGTGTGIYLIDRNGKAEAPVYAYPAWPIEAAPQFSDTNFSIENITFVDVYSPILISGAGNTIRNNNIHALLENRINEDGTPKFAGENKPKVAVMSYGPKALIEGNKIIQKTNNKGIPAYTIYLRHADGTVVRKNRVRVDGSREKTIAIGLSVSHNVTVEKNQLAHAEIPVEKKDNSDAIEVENDVNPLWTLW